MCRKVRFVILFKVYTQHLSQLSDRNNNTKRRKKNHCNIKSKVYSHLSPSKAIKLLENFSGTNKRLYQCNKSALILHCMCDNSNEILL